MIAGMFPKTTRPIAKSGSSGSVPSHQKISAPTTDSPPSTPSTRLGVIVQPSCFSSLSGGVSVVVNTSLLWDQVQCRERRRRSNSRGRVRNEHLHVVGAHERVRVGSVPYGHRTPQLVRRLVLVLLEPVPHVGEDPPGMRRPSLEQCRGHHRDVRAGKQCLDDVFRVVYPGRHGEIGFNLPAQQGDPPEWQQQVVGCLLYTSDAADDLL